MKAVEESFDMEKNRKIAILGFLFVLSIFTILLATGGDYLITFYWGIPVGMIFGFGTCVYLADVWDPRLLKSSTKEASLKLVWVVPLGVLAANLSSYFLDENIEWVLLGTIITWIYITLSYFIIQAWRYR